MPHVIELASTGRSKCRGCGERIAQGSLRFGESVPNPFADGDTTHWFHLDCGAYKRPEPFLQAAEARTEPLEGGERLVAEAKRGVEHPRLTRVDGAQRDPSGRAQCRSCKTAIAKGAWRISLVFYEEGRFVPAGFVHPPCAQAYFESADVLPRVKHFARNLSDDDLGALAAELQGSGSPAP